MLGPRALLLKELGDSRALALLLEYHLFFGGITDVLKKGTNNFLVETYG